MQKSPYKGKDRRRHIGASNSRFLSWLLSTKEFLRPDSAKELIGPGLLITWGAVGVIVLQSAFAPNPHRAQLNSVAPTIATASVAYESALLESEASFTPGSRTLVQWQHRSDWDFPTAWNSSVNYWVNQMTNRQRVTTEIWLERAGKYGPFIEHELARRGMPKDLLYLAMIESGFSNTAVSHASATGIWQFMAPTARDVGLEISHYVDERRDPIASTYAALDYLQSLYNRFDSWYLAIASYNGGQGRVSGTLKKYARGRYGDDNLFWQISPHLPKETRNYVPKMLALSYISKQPERFGFSTVKPVSPLHFELVTVPGTTSLKLIANMSNVPLSTIEELNPHLIRGITPPNRMWQVRVPPTAQNLLSQQFASLNSSPEARLSE